MYLHTGNAAFRKEADLYFDPETDFLTHWDSVNPIGIAILAGAEHESSDAGLLHTSEHYRRHFARMMSFWSSCSESPAPGATCKCVPISSPPFKLLRHILVRSCRGV